MTISVFQLPKETPTQTEVMQKLEEHLLAEFQKGNVIDQALLQTNDGFPRMLIECEAGDGIQKERAAGAFLKLMATTAQFIRIWA
jgi:hypothetical protein